MCSCFVFFFFFFQAEDGIRDFCLSRGLGMCIRDRLEGLRVQVERQHHFQATMQQLLMMLVLCGLDHLEQPAASDEQ